MTTDEKEHVHCECGAVMGERCEWSGPAEETVEIEWMPEHVRASHATARNSGSYPHNGAVRLRCEVSCAERIAESDAEWTTIARE